MKVWVKVAYSCRTLSKKPPPFSNPGYAPVYKNYYFISRSLVMRKAQEKMTIEILVTCATVQYSALQLF